MMMLHLEQVLRANVNCHVSHVVSLCSSHLMQRTYRKKNGNSLEDKWKELGENGKMWKRAGIPVEKWECLRRKMERTG